MSHLLPRVQCMSFDSLRIWVAVTCLCACTVSAAGAAAESTSQEHLIERIERQIRVRTGLRFYDWVTFALKGSTVTLSGFVSGPLLRETLEQRVLRLDGVESVANELTVLSLGGDDFGIQVNAYWKIYGHPELRRYARPGSEFRSRVRRAADDVQRVLVQPIHILVRQGHVTLEGEVESEREKSLAEEQASGVLGVQSVTNHLIVRGEYTEEHEVVTGTLAPWRYDESSLKHPVLRVENPSGRVAVKVVATDRLRVRKSSLDRETRKGDTRMTRFHRRTLLEARPPDGAVIDLDIDLPYGYWLEVVTTDGPISVKGLVRRAVLTTGTGEVELSTPWQLTRLEVASRYPPQETVIPDGPFEETNHDGAWRLSYSHEPAKTDYGVIEVKANWPRRLTLAEMDIPRDSPVRMHWEAPKILQSMFRPPFGRILQDRTLAAGSEFETTTIPGEGVARFSSDVRLVDLTVAVVDENQQPITSLGPGDFEVIENGALQEVEFVEGTETDFNLALLLDCSTSTLTEREAVVEAAKRFVSVARPQDRVAVYVLSDTYFHMLSPLTNARADLLRRIEGVPPLSGGTPLYDAIVIAYAQELAHRRWERNALVIISDGVDNRILPRSRGLVPSKIDFEELKRAAKEMNAVLYAIHLEAPETKFARKSPTNEWTRRARRQLEELAEVSGGRVFPARSIRALEPVYQRVARELRSVYTVGYYPKNQNFDGTWRRIQVRVKHPGAQVRTRPGYYAW